MMRPRQWRVGCDRHLSALEKETLTPEQKAHRMAELEEEEHQCLDACIERLDATVARIARRASA